MLGAERAAETTTPWRPAGVRWDLALFCAGLLGVGVAIGIAIEPFRLPPAATIDAAVDAARDWQENWRHYLGIRSKYLLPTTRVAGGVTTHDRAAAWPGYTFLTMYRDGTFGA